MNLSVIEEWIANMELPKNIGSHFAPVHDLLMWLQVCSTPLDPNWKSAEVSAVLVVHYRVFQSHRNYPEHEAFEPSAGLLV